MARLMVVLAVFGFVTGANQAQAQDDWESEAYPLGDITVPGSEPPPDPGAVLSHPEPGTVLTYRYTTDTAQWTVKATLSLSEFEGRDVEVWSLDQSISDPGFPCDGANRWMNDFETRGWVGCLKDDQFLAGTLPNDKSMIKTLLVGEKWDGFFRWTDNVMHPEYSWPVWASYEVADIEDVTVPAGTFSTYRVDTTTVFLANWGQIRWFSPDLGIYVKRVVWRTRSNPYSPLLLTEELVDIERPANW